MGPTLSARPAILYRHYDRKGRLLYVGISINGLARAYQHAAKSHWFADTVRIELEHFANRVQAQWAEVAAVQDENPKHNIQLKPRFKAVSAAESHIVPIAEFDPRTNTHKVRHPSRIAQAERHSQFMKVRHAVERDIRYSQPDIAKDQQAFRSAVSVKTREIMGASLAPR